MLKSIFNLLYLIYLNRYRRLAYKDESRFYVLLLIHIIGYYQLWTIDFEYKKIGIYIFLLLQSVNLLQRNDYKFLKKQIGSFYTHLLVSIDIMVFNLPLVSYMLYYSILDFTIIISILLLLPSILCLKKTNLHSIKIFHIVDPLWISHIRTKIWEYLLLIVSLYIQYQGIINYNEGLHLAGLCIIYFIVAQIYSEKESLYFYKFSKLSSDNILLNLFRYNILHYVYILLPSLLIVMLSYSHKYLFNIVYFFVSIPFLFWIRYIYINNDLLKNIIIFVLIFALIYNRLSDKYPIYIIFIIIIINTILYKFSKNKFSTLINK